MAGTILSFDDMDQRVEALEQFILLAKVSVKWSSLSMYIQFLVVNFPIRVQSTNAYTYMYMYMYMHFVCAHIATKPSAAHPRLRTCISTHSIV